MEVKMDDLVVKPQPVSKNLREEPAPASLLLAQGKMAEAIASNIGDWELLAKTEASNLKEIGSKAQNQLKTLAEKNKGNMLEFPRHGPILGSLNTLKPLKQKYYQQLGTLVPYQGPEIISCDQSIGPGSGITIDGLGFGATTGRVCVQFTQTSQIDLIVDSWTNTEIKAHMSPTISGIGPYDGLAWVITSGGGNSRVVPMHFDPVWIIYLMTWMDSFSGGVWGASHDNVLFEDNALDNSFFTVLYVEVSTSGSGWAKLQNPNARGQCLAQGYHVGITACHSVDVTVHYQIVGPRDMMPGNSPLPLYVLGQYQS
jgi:hypothetical protein